MGFLHRANSTFTWHNEVYAYMNVMKILRENMIDELDLLSNGTAGCDKVRERYYAQHVSLKDPRFQDVVMDHYEGRLFSGGGGDSTLEAFSKAGNVILTKGHYSRELRKMQREHPSISLVSRTLREADDLR